MKKLTIYLLLIFSVVSCTKETNLNLSVEKENFDKNYLANLEEMSELRIILEEQKNNIFNSTEDLQSQIASIDEQRFDYLLKSEKLSQSEKTEFEINLKTLGFSDLVMFNSYKNLLERLNAKFVAETNIDTKSYEEQVAIMESFLQSQSITPVTTRGIGDPTTLSGCQAQRDQCLQNAATARDNCVVYCGVGGFVVGGLSIIFSAGTLVGGAIIGSAACMSGCHGIYQIEAGRCNTAFDACVANLPG